MCDEDKGAMEETEGDSAAIESFIYPVTVRFESSYDACFYRELLEIISRYVVGFSAGVACIVCVGFGVEITPPLRPAILACHALVADCSSLIFVLLGFVLGYMHDRIDFAYQSKAMMLSIWIDVQVAALCSVASIVLMLLTLPSGTGFALSNVASTVLQSPFALDAVYVPAWSNTNKTSWAAMVTLHAMLMLPVFQSTWTRLVKYSSSAARLFVVLLIVSRLALAVACYLHATLFVVVTHTLLLPTLEMSIGILLFLERAFFRIESLDCRRVAEAGDLVCYLSMLFCMGATIEDDPDVCFRWTVFTPCVRADVILIPRGFLYAVLVCFSMASRVDAGPIDDDENARKIDMAINNCEVSVARFLSVFAVLCLLWPFMSLTSLISRLMTPRDFVSQLVFLLCGGIGPLLFLVVLKLYFTVKPFLFQVVSEQMESRWLWNLQTMFALVRR